MTKLRKYGALIIILLIAIIVIGSLVIWSGFNQSRPVEISIPPAVELRGEIYISGAVNNAGIYPLKTGDTIDELIQSAGGISDSANPEKINLNIPQTEEKTPQKVNINRAETWLLEALPGIGETRAQAIIAYRQQNGQFHNINELLKVEGIGASTYENVKNLITVAD